MREDRIKKTLITLKRAKGILKQIQFVLDSDIFTLRYYNHTGDITDLINNFVPLIKLKLKRRRNKKLLEKLVLQRLRLYSMLFKYQYNQRDLKAALREENYMEAARLRDIINANKEAEIVVANLEQMYLNK